MFPSSLQVDFAELITIANQSELTAISREFEASGWQIKQSSTASPRILWESHGKSRLTANLDFGVRCDETRNRMKGGENSDNT